MIFFFKLHLKYSKCLIDLIDINVNNKTVAL